jgi:hypothetical protein
MKKAVLIYLLLVIAPAVFSQTTYYWIGGVGPASYTNANNWNTQLNGFGTSRTAAGAQVTDILIFDGTNVGGTTPATGQVSATSSNQTCAQLKFINGANVLLNRAGTGSSAITINGDVGDDLVVDATSTLTLGGPSYNFDVNINIGAAAIAAINGTVYLGPLSASVHPKSYITAVTAGSVVFNTGSACYITDSTATSGFNSTAANSIVFKTGASLYYYSGRSPFGNNTATQYISFENGSNCYIRGSNVSYLDGITAYLSSNWNTQKVFANLYIQNGAVFTADGPFYKIDNFTVDNGCSFITHSSGHTPILGNLAVNGTISSPGGSTNVVVLGGNSAQTVSGTGSISVPNFIIANYSDVTLAKSVSVAAGAVIQGKVNFGAANQLTGAGTFTSRVTSTSPTVTGNTATGSYIVTGITGTITGNAGLHVAGTGIDVNTNVTGFSMANSSITLSKPALATVTGTTLTFTSDSATLVTSNPNGMDTLTGGVVMTGAKSFQSGTNYIINAATTAPFGISSGNPTSMTAGTILLNAPVTTNYNMKVAATLALNSGKLTIRPQDTLRILSGNDIAGAPFSISKYIISSLAGNNAGVLRIDNFSSSKLFPVGSATNYLPATFTPSSTMDFLVSVYEGVTQDGTPTGPAFTAAQKATIVDAVWNIKRPNGSGDCVVQAAWPASLEGSTFSSYSDAQIGLGQYSGGNWGIVTGAGDNTLNTAASTFTSFAPFSVGFIGYILPLQFGIVAAKFSNGGIAVNWNVFNDDKGYTYSIEKSSDGVHYVTIGFVAGTNKGSYTYTDVVPFTGKNYYRIKATGITGSIKYSSIVLMQEDKNATIAIYPNPVVNTLHIAGLKTNATIRIINAAGQIVLQQIATANALSVDVSKLATGIYTIEIITEGKAERKVVVK